MGSDTDAAVVAGAVTGRMTSSTPGLQSIPRSAVLDFDSDEPLFCNRDQSGDKTCESCQ